jgi:uncharacterized membrane protein
MSKVVVYMVTHSPNTVCSITIYSAYIYICAVHIFEHIFMRSRDTTKTSNKQSKLTCQLKKTIATNNNIYNAHEKKEINCKLAHNQVQNS